MNHDEPPHFYSLMCYECKTPIDGDDGGRMVNGVYLCEECVDGVSE